jgi:hypothetical protein
VHRTTRFAILRVLNSNVALGKGKSLPQGVYEGTIHIVHLSIKGRRVEYMSKVSINLSAEFLAQILGERLNGHRSGVVADFTTNFRNGDIIEIPFNDSDRGSRR